MHPEQSHRPQASAPLPASQEFPASVQSFAEADILLCLVRDSRPETQIPHSLSPTKSVLPRSHPLRCSPFRRPPQSLPAFSRFFCISRPSASPPHLPQPVPPAPSEPQKECRSCLSYLHQSLSFVFPSPHISSRPLLVISHLVSVSMNPVYLCLNFCFLSFAAAGNLLSKMRFAGYLCIEKLADRESLLSASIVALFCHSLYFSDRCAFAFAFSS